MDATDRALEDAMADFARSASGAGMSPEVEGWIAQAGLLRDQPEAALALLHRARHAAPNHPAPLIALYRYYFYGHQLAQARCIGEDALAIARTALGHDFGDEPLSPALARYNATARFYLFTLKALAYLSMRLGDLTEAHKLLRELRRLDPGDRVGGALLSHILERHESGLCYDEAADTVDAYPTRGWAGTSL